jgi:hypothetical protein
VSGISSAGRCADRGEKSWQARALRVSGGVYAHAAKLLSEATGRSCTRQNIQHWIRKHPKLTETVREAVEEIKDLAETALIENIRNRDTNAIKFYLETKAKDRGYVRQYKVTGAEGQPLTAPPAQVVVYIPDNGRDPEIVKAITHAEYHTKRNGASTA